MKLEYYQESDEWVLVSENKEEALNIEEYSRNFVGTDNLNRDNAFIPISILGTHFNIDISGLWKWISSSNKDIAVFLVAGENKEYWDLGFGVINYHENN